ncbi:hypothetical protein [Endozoicomonas sp. ONNA1]|uniref:hypothetical protein n=1 Tax=Endozoicomonas sp. ONNA1 TaxID=2828740 RepID=UPI002148FEFF|nr:hypothetical protein [Endozoicomonas sp. ONNA1]
MCTIEYYQKELPNALKGKLAEGMLAMPEDDIKLWSERVILDTLIKYENYLEMYHEMQSHRDMGLHILVMACVDELVVINQLYLNNNNEYANRFKAIS